MQTKNTHAGETKRSQESWKCHLRSKYYKNVYTLLVHEDIFLKQIVERERNVLFNDTLNIFYLRLYGVRHMVKDHSDSERGNPLPPHGLLFPINNKGSFI